MFFIREKSGMDFALPRNAHKESVGAVRGLVNPADAGCLGRTVHN